MPATMTNVVPTHRLREDPHRLGDDERAREQEPADELLCGVRERVAFLPTDQTR
jgi:hypothetical protein